MVVTVYFVAFYLAYFVGEKAVVVFSAKNSLVVGSLLNALYVAVYLFPVYCKANTKGVCNHIFSTVLLLIFAVIGGCGASVTWTAKTAYLQQCSDSQTEQKHSNIFNIVTGFGGVLAGLFGLALLADDHVRAGLYIIMLILAVNAVLIQLCTPLA